MPTITAANRRPDFAALPDEEFLAPERGVTDRGFAEDGVADLGGSSDALWGTKLAASPGRTIRKDDVVDRALGELEELAADPDRFHAHMSKSFGPDYDREAAEAIRGKLLAGDRSWLPTIELASADDLGGALGAYDKAGGAIYLQREMVSPKRASEVLIEELGHHLDQLLNKGRDSAGDEGEIFRRLVTGETLSDATLSDLRSENDHGRMTIDGKTVEVENWGFPKWLGDWIWGSKPVQDTLKATKDRLLQAVGQLSAQLNAATKGWFDDLIANAKAYGAQMLQSAEKIANGFVKLSRGDFAGGLADIGVAILDQSFSQYHAFARLTIDTVSAVQTAVGLEPIGRGLRPDEEERLRKIFGDSIDYSAVTVKEGSAGIFAGDRALTMGNTIYMKDDKSFETLVHEMTHVWQFQNGGNDYMAKAGWAQLSGWAQGETGYEWRKDIDRGWAALNPEQQAKLIEDGAAHYAKVDEWNGKWRPTRPKRRRSDESTPCRIGAQVAVTAVSAA